MYTTSTICLQDNNKYTTRITNGRSGAATNYFKLFITYYYEQLSAEIKMKNYKFNTSPGRTKLMLTLRFI